MSTGGPNNNRINCLFSAVEADPLIKVGGLGDVAFSLPNALRNLHSDEIDGKKLDVRLVLPCHADACKGVKDKDFRLNFDVQTNLGAIPTTVFLSEIKGMPVYLISSELIPQNTPVYTSDIYQDGLKFLFFSQAVMQLAGALDWDLDVLHVNDWHTAIIPHLLKRGKRSGDFPKKTRSILTVHNLPFMGSGTQPVLHDLGIPFSNDRKLPAWARRLPLPMGLSASDLIVAVSPTYAQEIRTPEFGNGLNEYLSTRTQAISGIINGLDTALWNPAEDQELSASFSLDTLSTRQQNKTSLQNRLQLETNPDIPLLAFIGRMEEQKGVDLVLDALTSIKNLSWQAVLLGTGNSVLETNCLQLQAALPERVRAEIKFDSRLARKIYGGADILLMPSRYEPCGLAQMIAMRYGCVPLAHATGGLIDTITDIQQGGTATGFLFEECTARSLAKTIRRAIKEFKNKPAWARLQKNGMKKDFSWHQSALSYADLYMNKGGVGREN